MGFITVLFVILLLVFPIAISASHFTSESFDSPAPVFSYNYITKVKILVISGSFYTKTKLSFVGGFQISWAKNTY